jgi:hypothetical protein
MHHFGTWNFHVIAIVLVFRVVFFQHAAPWNLSALLVEKGEIISMERLSSLGGISELR